MELLVVLLGIVTIASTAPESSQCTGCGNLPALIGNYTADNTHPKDIVSFQPSVSYDLSNRCEFAHVTCDSGAGNTASREFNSPMYGLVSSPYFDEVVTARLFCESGQWKYTYNEVTTLVDAVYCDKIVQISIV